MDLACLSVSELISWPNVDHSFCAFRFCALRTEGPHNLVHDPSQPCPTLLTTILSDHPSTPMFGSTVAHTLSLQEFRMTAYRR